MDNNHMAEPWLDQALMDSAYKCALPLLEDKNFQSKYESLMHYSQRSENSLLRKSRSLEKWWKYKKNAYNTALYELWIRIEVISQQFPDMYMMMNYREMFLLGIGSLPQTLIF